MIVESAGGKKSEFRAMVDAGTLLEKVDVFRIEANRTLDQARRAKLGQFLTPPPVARLMASMFSEHIQTLNILDAGAGVGSLTAALIAEKCHEKLKPKSINVTAYEIEPLLVNYLQATFDECSDVCDQSGIKFTGEIFQEDFISAAVAMENSSLVPNKRKRFNCVIMNPPYCKIGSKSKARQLLRRVDIETGNLYTAFLWLSLKIMETNGEIVAITPRSFCNGPYFLPFRKALLKMTTLRRIHIFDSRTKAFQEDDVLQENIIIHIIKSTDRIYNKLMVSSSIGPDDDLAIMSEIDYTQLVQPDDPYAVIRIVPDDVANKIVEQMQKLDLSLAELNLAVSTGKVVDFRAKERGLLKEEPTMETVPLIYPGHFSHGYVTWPNRNFRKPEALAKVEEMYHLLVPAGFYVLVKRFSAKEEDRRIVAAVYDPDRISADFVGFENHLNYYHRRGQGLSRDLAKGLAAFLNSTLVDQYFRQFSGHTQVNAADLRSLRYPSEAKLKVLGSKIGNSFPAQHDLDHLIRDTLSISVTEDDPK